MQDFANLVTQAWQRNRRKAEIHPKEGAMKRLRSVLATLILIVAGGVASASAQSVRTTMVNIPFGFSFASKSFPPGSYLLGQTAQHFLVLRDAHGKILAMAFTTAVQSAKALPVGKVTFRSVDGQNVFSEIWNENDNSGEKLPFVNPRGVEHRSSDITQMVDTIQR